MALASGMQGISGLGQTVSGAIGTSAYGSYQQQLGRINGGLADQQAQQALARGEVMASRAGQQTGALQGAQRVALASQGVDVNKGSAARVQADTAAAGAVDRNTIMNNAALQAWGYGVEAANARAQGEMAGIEARGRVSQSLISGGMNFANSMMQTDYWNRQRPGERARVPTSIHGPSGSLNGRRNSYYGYE